MYNLQKLNIYPNIVHCRDILRPIVNRNSSIKNKRTFYHTKLQFSLHPP